MATEIELCLSLWPEAAPLLVDEVALAYGVAPRTRELVSVYYDTPDLLLARRRMGLRLRRAGEQWIQTVKFGQMSDDGLSARRELEHVTRGQALELQHIDDPEVQAFLGGGDVAPRLAPVFVTRITRTLWNVADAQGGQVELALDVGVIEAQGCTEPVHELEIELKQGALPLVFDVAQRLAQRVALLPQPCSKAERGYRLCVHKAVQPSGAQAPVLPPDATGHALAQALVGECLRHLHANLPWAADGAQPEFLHQSRVALRRLRSAWALLDLQAQGPLREWLDGLRRLGTALGAARDWQVLAQTVHTVPVLQGPASPESIAALRTAVDQAATQARLDVQQQLQQPATGQVLLQGLRWLHLDGGQALSGLAARKVGDRALTRAHRAVARLARLWPTLDVPARHTLRKRTKRLRYEVEFLAALYPRRRVATYRAVLQRLQEELGILNDAAVADTLLSTLYPRHPDVAYAAGLLCGWSRCQSDAAVHRLATWCRDRMPPSRFWSR